jgi:WD40 repeat protein
VAFSPDGEQIVSSSSDYTIKLWDAQTGAELRTLKGHYSLVSSVAFSPDEKQIVSGSTDGTIKLWDAQTGEPLP